MSDVASQKTRVQVDLSPREMERLAFMAQLCGTDTRKDLFNLALTVLEWSLKETLAGRTVGSFDEIKRERRVLALPAFDNVRASPNFVAAHPAEGSPGSVYAAAEQRVAAE